jgi:hypothetical protein
MPMGQVDYPHPVLEHLVAVLARETRRVGAGDAPFVGKPAACWIEGDLPKALLMDEVLDGVRPGDNRIGERQQDREKGQHLQTAPGPRAGAHHQAFTSWNDTNRPMGSAFAGS